MNVLNLGHTFEILEVEQIFSIIVSSYSICARKLWAWHRQNDRKQHQPVLSFYLQSEEKPRHRMRLFM